MFTSVKFLVNFLTIKILPLTEKFEEGVIARKRKNTSINAYRASLRSLSITPSTFIFRLQTFLNERSFQKACLYIYVSTRKHKACTYGAIRLCTELLFDQKKTQTISCLQKKKITPSMERSEKKLAISFLYICQQKHIYEQWAWHFWMDVELCNHRKKLKYSFSKIHHINKMRTFFFNF